MIVGGGLLLYYLCLLYVHYEQYYQNDSPSSSIGLLLLHGCNDALSRKWQLNIGTMAQHGCTSGAASDDVLSPRIAEAGLSMHLSVTYHSPNCRRKSNLLSLFSVHDLSNGVYRAILAVSVGDDCWKPDSVGNTLTCGRHMILFPFSQTSSWKHHFDDSDILLVWG